MNIKDMTLEQKIGQMIMAGFPSGRLDDHIKEIIQKYHIGNIILFARNVNGKVDLANLNRSIQEYEIENTSIPAFISIDQEGGMVTRIYEGATFMPGNMAVAAGGSLEAAYKEGRIAGEELRALGINVNIAPVLDVNNNPENPVIGVRSYGDDPEKVAGFGSNYIRGLEKGQVVATAKHFPGHGDTSIDSHLSLPVVNYSMERLQKIELYPFKEAISAGVDAIMTAHILFTAIENRKIPATLSYKVLTNLLRESMGFKGIIMTDCMEMKAISTYFGTSKAAVMAVKAGADIICISHTLSLQIESCNAIKEAVLNGEIAEKRIDESVDRIINMKRKYNLFENPYPDMQKVDKMVGCADHREFAKSISSRSITLVKDRKGLVPVKYKRIVSISTEPAALTGADDTIIKKETFCKAVKEELGGEAYVMLLDPDDDAIKNMVEMCKGADVVIIGTYNANLNKGQAKLVNKINRINGNTIVVSLRNPYDIMVFDDVPAYICAYEYTKLSLKSVIDVLKGRQKAVGSLPVKIR